jgi:hypothetical protein
MKQETIDKLVAPFNNVKEKDGPWDPVKKKRIKLKYIPGTDIIERLNEAFDYTWSFEVVHSETIEDQVIVRGRLTTYDDENGNVIIKENYGSSIIKRYSGGSNEGKPIDLGFDFKGAATDCIKKCATMVGVALRIEDMDASEAGTPGPAPKKPSPVQKKKEEPKKPKTSDPVMDELPPVPDDFDAPPIKFPGEKSVGGRPPRPDYSIPPLSKNPEPSKVMETPEPIGNSDASTDEDGPINANQLSVLKTMVVRKGKSPVDIITEALDKSDAPEAFENLTRAEAKKVLALAYQLEDIPPEG